jgi:uncharacterized protein DUF4136
MQFRRLAFVAGLAVPLACATPIHVRTAAAPDAQFANLHTFIVMAAPQRRDANSSNDDPMLQNSITYHALHNDLVSNFQERGYVIDSTKPDFAVAAYATARQKLNVNEYDYGYPYWRHGWWGPIGVPDVTEYTEGTVVVDVINPTSKELLWRGQGVADVSDDPQTYAKELARTVAHIVDRFPEQTQSSGVATSR